MLYERIKELCKQNGTTISALEKDCGFARGSVSKIDKHKPSAEKLQKIADYFGVTVEALTGVQTSGQQPEYYIDDEAAQYGQAIFENPKLRALFHAVRGIKDTDLDLMVGMAERFKETNPDG